MADLVPSLILSWFGVAIAALAFLNRNKPAWQRDMKAIYLLALVQVGLGSMGLVIYFVH